MIADLDFDINLKIRPFLPFAIDFYGRHANHIACNHAAEQYEITQGIKRKADFNN